VSGTCRGRDRRGAKPRLQTKQAQDVQSDTEHDRSVLVESGRPEDHLGKKSGEQHRSESGAPIIEQETELQHRDGGQRSDDAVDELHQQRIAAEDVIDRCDEVDEAIVHPSFQRG
jgi:hypothetical protein